MPISFNFAETAMQSIDGPVKSPPGLTLQALARKAELNSQGECSDVAAADSDQTMCRDTASLNSYLSTFRSSIFILPCLN